MWRLSDFSSKSAAEIPLLTLQRIKVLPWGRSRLHSFVQTGEWVWQTRMYCLTCAERPVHALPATLREFPSRSPILRYFQSPRLPGECRMSKGNKKERKKDGWFGWEDGREHDRWYIIYSLSCQGDVIGLISLWSGKQEKGGMLWWMVWWWIRPFRFILYLQLALLHTRTRTSDMNHGFISEQRAW